jgi:hypothetical protein
MCRGVDKFFKTLAKLASSSAFSFAKLKKKTTTDQCQTGSGFVFLLANPEFHVHLANWRVVIRTPGMCVFRTLVVISSFTLNA